MIKSVFLMFKKYNFIGFSIICILGSEFAGEVLEVGKDVTGLSVGDVVVGLANTDGIQEVLTVPAFMLDLVSSLCHIQVFLQ